MTEAGNTYQLEPDKDEMYLDHKAASFQVEYER